MDKRFVFTGIAVGAVLAISLMFASMPERENIIPMHEAVSDVGLPPAAEKGGGYAYVLKEHEGRIAVYVAGEAEPEMILDVLVKHLPDFDRHELAAGIGVRDYEELVSRIEDYTS